jgi:hypothetical protein
MTEVDRLKWKARTICKLRGHIMTKFGPISKINSFAAYCKQCGRSVLVTPDLLPNDYAIGGSATVIDCKVKVDDKT